MSSLDARPARPHPAEAEFNPKGVAFLREHGLQIVPSDDFVVPEDKPYIVATDHTHFHLRYSAHGSKTAACIIDHTRQTPRNSLRLLINMLSSYVEEFETLNEARKREAEIKRLTREEKIELVNVNKKYLQENI